MKDGFYTNDMCCVTLAVNDKFYLITGDEVCMTEKFVPGIMAGLPYDEMCDYLSKCSYSSEIKLTDFDIPWIGEDCEMIVNINDVDIDNAVSCDELWDMTRKYFNY